MATPSGVLLVQEQPWSPNFLGTRPKRHSREIGESPYAGLSFSGGAFLMPWSAKFATPIALNDGRQLMTLDDAAELLMGLPDARLHKPAWVKAIDVLIDASDDEASASAIAEAEAKLAAAFKLEGLI